MNILDLVQVKNDKSYRQFGIFDGMRGVVVDKNDTTEIDVLFFNPAKIGEYVVAKISRDDLIVEKEELPQKAKQEILSQLDWIIKNAHAEFSQNKFKAYDNVQLVNDGKYKQYGLAVGDVGTVVDDVVVKDCVLVQFDNAKPDEDGFVDCISVNINDLIKASKIDIS